MQFSGKGQREGEDTQNKTPNKPETRPNFVFIAGLIGILVLVIYAFTSVYPSRLFREVKAVPTEPQALLVNSHPVMPESPEKTAAIKLFDNTEKVWTMLFKKMGKTYTKPSLQLFTDTITAESCGYGKPATGSFYCQQDDIIYLDLSIFQSLKKNHPSISDMAQAYMVAHQAGHHIQDLLGTTAKVDAAYSKLENASYQKLAEKEELQADYYAGVWAHYAWKGKPQMDDIDLGLAISLVNQTYIERMTLANTDVPDAHSHLTGVERAKWFSKGYYMGDPKKTDVFNAGDLQ